MNPERVEAQPYADPTRTAEQNATALAAVVLKALRKGQAVEVSLKGVRGTSSTFFNVLLAQIVEGVGLATLREHVTFVCETTTQSLALARSMEVVAA